MLYTIELGPIEQNIVKQAIRAGEPIPDRIAAMPELRFGLNFVFEAFFDLDTERSHNLGLTYIPRSKIKEYANDYHLGDEQASDFIYLIRRMDEAHIANLHSKLPTKDK